MSLTPLHPADQTRLDAARAFLAQAEGTAMFPLAALFAGRLAAPEAALAHPHALHAWVAEAGGRITGFVGLSGSGRIMPRWPTPEAAALRPTLAGRTVDGLVGPADEAAPVLSALGLDRAPRRTDAVEPGYALDLAALQLPPDDGTSLRPIRPEDEARATLWRIAYLGEVQNLTPEAAAPRAARDVGAWRAAGSHRLLWRGAEPVALTGFNASLPEVVQVGAVYVPPEARGRGLARRAVGLHLAEARAQGTQRAVLFAASPAAEAAYRALGFRPSAAMTVIEFAEPQEITP